MRTLAIVTQELQARQQELATFNQSMQNSGTHDAVTVQKSISMRDEVNALMTEQQTMQYQHSTAMSVANTAQTHISAFEGTMAAQLLQFINNGFLPDQESFLSLWQTQIGPVKQQLVSPDYWMQNPELATQMQPHIEQKLDAAFKYIVASVQANHIASLGATPPQENAPASYAQPQHRAATQGQPNAEVDANGNPVLPGQLDLRQKLAALKDGGSTGQSMGHAAESLKARQAAAKPEVPANFNNFGNGKAN